MDIMSLTPGRTIWHITFGTYGCRLHGDGEATVERTENQPGQPFVAFDPQRADRERQRMKGSPVQLGEPQRLFVEQRIPLICERGGWTYRIAAAPPPPEHDHVHVLLDADPAIDGRRIRQWLKRWLTESLNDCFDPPSTGWWAEGGSAKPVKHLSYLHNTVNYIRKQRTTPL